MIMGLIELLKSKDIEVIIFDSEFDGTNFSDSLVLKDLAEFQAPIRYYRRESLFWEFSGCRV